MPKDTAATTAHLLNLFWDRADDINAGMLSATDVSPRPMSHVARRDDQALWFITADGTDIHQAAVQGKDGQYILACAHGQLYATIEGSLALVTDSEKLDDVWSPIAGAWFEDGKQDPDVRLVRFTPKTGEIWATDGSAKFLYEIAKAHITDEIPDMGDTGKITF